MRLPYPRVAGAEAALSAWTATKLREAVGILGTAVLAVRRDGEMARPIAARALWTLARMAGRGRN